MSELSCNNINYINGPTPEKNGAPVNKRRNRIGSISKILKLILTAFSLPQKPAIPLPPILILSGAKLRPGLDAKTIAARIITRQTEAGLIPGDVFADGPNTSEAMEVIRMEELINSLQTEAKIEAAMSPGIPMTAIGVTTAPGTPMVVQGATTAIASVNGIIR